MILQFDNIYKFDLPKDGEYESIRIQKAVLPMSYFNVAGELHNNYMKYVIIEGGAIQTNGSLIIPDGLYSVETYNDAIQAELKKIDMDKVIEIEYLEERGKIRLKMNNDKFALKLHDSICNFLGIKCDGGYTRDTVIGWKTCNFMRHRKYVIECNLVDDELNLINGERSSQVDYFIPYGKRYGDLSLYIPRIEKKVKIRDFPHSNISIKIKN